MSKGETFNMRVSPLLTHGLVQAKHWFMHVLQLGPYPPPEGGINRNMLAIREELFANGHRCSIIATSRSTRVTPEDDVHHPTSPFTFVKRLFTLRCDILHLHVGGDITKRIMALVFLCLIAGHGKKILSFHSGGYPTTKEGKAARTYSIRGFLFRRFARVIAVNPTIAEVFSRYGLEAKNIRVIYPFVHCVPDAKVEPAPELLNFCDTHSPFLLTVGLLEPEYDLFMQIEAMEKILRKSPDAGLMIVGSGSLEADLRAAIDSKAYKEQIFLAGDVEHKVTLHLIDRCDALLRTTLFDGDAISVREALFLETPVIATDNGMRPEGVRLIPMQDREALEKQIEALDERQRESKSVKSDDKTNINAVLRVYEELSEPPAVAGG